MVLRVRTQRAATFPRCRLTENPRRVRTLTLIEPPAFWVLPNHGDDDAGAREMQEFVCCAISRSRKRMSSGSAVCSATARVDDRHGRRRNGISGCSPQLTSGLAYDRRVQRRSVATRRAPHPNAGSRRRRDGSLPPGDQCGTGSDPPTSGSVRTDGGPQLTRVGSGLLRR
jgi:hypothetical protein